MHIHSVSTRLKYSIAVAIAGGLAYGPTAMTAPASGSAYYTDPQSSHVEDATSKSIGQVNMITCFMSNMRPDALVNQGPYIALVDQNKCDPERRSSSSNSGSSDGATQAADYLNAVVNSTRASNSDPMLFNVWVNDENDGQPTTIYLHASATAAPSAANPYGQFRLDFCGKANSGGSGCMMNGAMQGSDGSLSYFETEGGGNGTRTTALKLSSVGTTTGSGGLDTIQSENNVSQEETFNFSYDQNYFLRGDQCFSRDATDPGTGLSVWRYGLYDSVTGDRVTRNSGFPIQYTAGGTTFQGYLGYWGLSLPSAATATLTSGATVQKVDYQNGSAATATNYTVVKADGKLTKYTKKTRTLQELDQIQFNAFIGDATTFFAGATSNTQYVMYWDEAAGNFKVTGQTVCDQSGCQTHDLDTVQSVSPSFWSNQGGIQGWSQALGGELFVDLHGAGSTVQSAGITVVYRQQDLVYPSDMPATLHCLNNCPTAATLAGYFVQGSSAQSPFATTSYNNWNPTLAANVVNYSSSTQSAVLLDETSASVTLADSTAFQLQPQYQNGLRSGRLFENLSDAECSLGSGTYCDYKVNSAEVYYIWETGPNNWNQFAAVKDSGGDFVKFDAPLQVNYVVPSGAAYGQYAGKTLVLQYGGFGDLWGIPGACVSHLTNQPVSCDTQDSRYVPQFVIPFDTTTGQVTNGQSVYVVKWLEREIRFARKATSVCTNAGLTAPTGIVLPTSADLKDPSNPSSDVYVGVKPAVSAAPRVIDGEVKY